MKIPVARFRCRHQDCSRVDPVKNNFSMSTIYEHIAVHLQTDTGRSEHLNLGCSCSKQYAFVALPYATCHLSRNRKEIGNHAITCKQITLNEVDASSKMLSYIKRFCGFHKYAMEDDNEPSLVQQPVLNEDERMLEMGGNYGFPMGMPPYMGSQMAPNMHPPVPQMMFPSPYGGMPNPGYMFPPQFLPATGVGSTAEDNRADGSRTPARTPVYGSPPRPTGCRTPNPYTSDPPLGTPGGGFNQKHKDTSFNATNNRFAPMDSSFSQINSSMNDTQRNDREAGTSAYRGGRGRGNFHGDQSGRGRNGNRSFGAGTSADSRRDDGNSRPPNRRVRGTSPRSSDDDQPLAKRPSASQFNGAERQRNDSGSQNRNEERKPNSIHSNYRSSSTTTAQKPRPRENTSPRSDSDNERPRNGGSDNRAPPPSRSHPPPRSSDGRRGGGPSRTNDMNGGASRSFTNHRSSTSDANTRRPQKKKGMGDISDRSDSD